MIKAGQLLLFIIFKKVNPMERAVRGRRGKGEGIWVLEFYSKGGLAACTKCERNEAEANTTRT